jgi:hypothetical protein
MKKFLSLQKLISTTIRSFRGDIWRLQNVDLSRYLAPSFQLIGTGTSAHDTLARNDEESNDVKTVYDSILLMAVPKSKVMKRN